MKKATHQKTRAHNSTLVLQTIYHDSPQSRADIARATGLTRTTVSELVGGLLGEGLVRETGVGPSLVGKPPIHVEIVEEARQLLCVDLGEEEFRGAVLNLRGEVLHRLSRPLEARKGEGAIQEVLRLVEGLWATVGAPVLGIGIGTPGPVDPARGIIRQSVNRGWVNVDLKALLAERFRVPIHIANDCHVAALAECAYGGHGRNPSLVLVKAGEGVGSGIILGGALLTGEGHSAGEIGHLRVAEGGMSCSCGNRGCLETVASTPSLLARARERARLTPASALGRAARRQGVSLGLLQELNDGGDPEVRALVKDLGIHLAAAAASLAGILNIRRIVLTGTPAGFGEPLLEALRGELEARILPSQARETEIGFSALGSDIVIRGAGALVLRAELDLP